MSTRCGVLYQTEVGTFKGTYIHCDGYIEGVGVTLQRKYRSKERIKLLVDSSAYYSSLFETVKESLENSKHPETGHLEVETLEEVLEYGQDSDLEYIYVFVEDGFLVSHTPFTEFFLLEDLIAEIKS